MSAAPDIPRKIRQLENDIESIYELLARINLTQVRHGNRFEELAATQAEHTATLAGHTATLAEHGATLAGHTAKLDRIIELLESR